MLLERAELLIKDGMEADFLVVLQGQVAPLLRGVPGVGEVRSGRGVENPGKFVLLVEWASMDAHTAFKSLPQYPRMQQLMGPFAKGGAMEHFEVA